MPEPSILRRAEDLSPEFMTAVLRERGDLQEGMVVAVTCISDGLKAGYVSTVARAALRYSADARGTLPSSVFLKLSRADLHPEHLTAAAREVAFYRAMAGRGGASLPRSYSAEADDTGRTHIVMEDLSETHFQRPQPIASRCSKIDARQLLLRSLG